MGWVAAFEDPGWGVKWMLWIGGGGGVDKKTKKTPKPHACAGADGGGVGRGGWGVPHCSGRMPDVGARRSALEADDGHNSSLLVRRLLLLSLRYCFLFSLFPDRTP